MVVFQLVGETVFWHSRSAASANEVVADTPSGPQPPAGEASPSPAPASSPASVVATQPAAPTDVASPLPSPAPTEVLAPTALSAAPTDAAPTPTDAAPAPSEVAPAPNEQPAPTDAAPAPSEVPVPAIPATPTDAVPGPSEAAPAPSNISSTPTDAASAPSVVVTPGVPATPTSDTSQVATPFIDARPTLDTSTRVDIAITPSASAVDPGQQIDFTLTASSSSSLQLLATVIIDLPDSFAVMAAGSPMGTCEVSGNQVVCSVQVIAERPAAIAIRAYVLENSLPGTVSSIATIFGGVLSSSAAAQIEIRPRLSLPTATTAAPTSAPSSADENPAAPQDPAADPDRAPEAPSDEAAPSMTAAAEGTLGGGSRPAEGLGTTPIEAKPALAQTPTMSTPQIQTGLSTGLLGESAPTPSMPSALPPLLPATSSPTPRLPLLGLSVLAIVLVIRRLRLWLLKDNRPTAS